MDGRRHSVDIPISRALVALRRVRSLRDPSTNSMTKFATLVENVNWDTNSCNGISLQFVDGPAKGSSLDNGLSGSHMDNKLVPVSKLISCEDVETHQGGGKECSGRKPREKYCHDLMEEERLDCVAPHTNHLADVDSCSVTMAKSPLTGDFKHYGFARKSYLRRECGIVADLSSWAGSPTFPTSDAFPIGSSQNTSLMYSNEEIDDLDARHFGGKVSCCWSRTPKLKCSSPFSGFEDNPLLRDGSELSQYGHRDRRKLYNVESTPYSETPRCLSQKYKPKSFHDLAGQSVVVRSLLGAISSERVSSVYLFHGPRGTGKTSAARIFAAALNCLDLEEHGPCGLCRECVVFYSGMSKDVLEIDSFRLNQADALRSLLKSASSPPSSRFKVFIMDECQLMREETWAMISNSLQKISRHSVLLMVSPDLDKLPRSMVSRSQRYHFPKIKDADITCRLKLICAEEGIDFDRVALDFIAAKSNGSLRDAEMMLDQLSLLGQRITISMAHELVGTVSEEDLLDLLDLAFSSDTSNTVIKARELLRSRVDPVQLTSQLASLIMDVLSGNCQEHISEARKSFSQKHNSEADLHKLGHALKILSDTEKQLRTSKNQTTWLTVALLQLSSSDNYFSEEHDLKFCSKTVMEKDVDGDSRGSRAALVADRKKNSTHSSSDNDKSCCLRSEEDYRQILDSTWRRAVELCKSNSLKNFLRKQGKILSLGLNNGMVVAELEFDSLHNVSRAEKSWKEIASALQYILGCNVEIRINVSTGSSAAKCSKAKKASFNLFGCSRRMEQKRTGNSEPGSDSECSGYASEKPMIGDRSNVARLSNSESLKLRICHHQDVAGSTYRNGDGNVLVMGNWGSDHSHRSSSHDREKRIAARGCINCSEEETKFWRHHVVSDRDSGTQCECCCREKETNSKEKQNPSTASPSGHANETPRRSSCERLKFAGDLDGMMESWDLVCWRTPRLGLRRTWHERQSRSRSRLMGWVLPCAAAVK